MRLDYKEERVLVFSLVWALGMLIFGWIGYRLNLDIWGGVAGGVAVLAIYTKLCGWDGWDFLDATVLLGFGFAVFYFAFMSNWLGGAAAVVGGLVVFLSHRTYRKWQWYKSGRLGISGLVGLAYWGLVEAILLFRHLPGWIGAITLAISVVAILTRSRVSLRKS